MPALTRKLDAKALNALDPALLAQPLAYILADHHRQRGLCSALEALGEQSPPDARLLRQVLIHIETEMALHRADEEEDLFPLLRARARDEDIDRVLALLTREHRQDEIDTKIIAEGLVDVGERKDAALTLDLCDRIRLFVRRQRRHLAVENAIIMPLAEARLGATDLRLIAENMARRRGLPMPPAPPPASRKRK
jgi:iron-sulfur cluster repair protein YtfE (RIC family)